MIRTALAFIAGLTCTAAGFRQASALQAADKRIRRWTELLRHLALVLSEGRNTLPEAFLLVASGNAQPDRLLHSLAQTMQQHPLLSLPECWTQLDIPGEESPILRRLMQRLGHGSRENRCQALDQALKELDLLAEQSRPQALKDAKMWRTLGCLGGAALFLMLI